VLVDARHGLVEQTRRHASLSHRCWASRIIVLAVNKMDLVDWSEARFDPATATWSTCGSRCSG
jgi:sulfate adenylyltransferase subunit 1 (EFTu-like GTPase family)